MSATATATLTRPALQFRQPAMMTVSASEPPGARAGCPQCGFEWKGDAEEDGAAQRRIEELEAQIRGLNEKAIETAEKLANYEEQIHSLRSQAQKNDIAQAQADAVSTPIPTTPTLNRPELSRTPSSPSQVRQQQQQQQQPTQNRLGAFASFLRSNSLSRPSTADPSAQSAGTPTQTATSGGDADLQDALNREQALRRAAETRLTQANSELEDLTATLFGQANEMVAQERRARAKLEERVEVLERRDGEKRRRLERLEKAIARVERVRGMVG